MQGLHVRELARSPGTELPDTTADYRRLQATAVFRPSQLPAPLCLHRFEAVLQTVQSMSQTIQEQELSRAWQPRTAQCAAGLRQQGQAAITIIIMKGVLDLLQLEVLRADESTTHKLGMTSKLWEKMLMWSAKTGALPLALA